MLLLLLLLLFLFLLLLLLLLLGIKVKTCFWTKVGCVVVMCGASPSYMMEVFEKQRLCF